MKLSILFLIGVGWLAPTADAQRYTRKPTTPAQTTAINQARSFLAGTPYDPAGYTIGNADVKGTGAAWSDPNISEIGVDFDRIAEVVDPNTPGAPGQPGLALIAILHEMYHINEGVGNSELGEFLTTCAVQGFLCSLIYAISEQGGVTDSLCALFEHVQDLMDQVSSRMLTTYGVTCPTTSCPHC